MLIIKVKFLLRNFRCDLLTNYTLQLFDYTVNRMIEPVELEHLPGMTLHTEWFSFFHVSPTHSGTFLWNLVIHCVSLSKSIFEDYNDTNELILKSSTFILSVEYSVWSVTTC